MALDAACQRLAAAIERLEAAVAAHGARDQAERDEASAALRAVQSERASLSDVNRETLDRLDGTIGRLRGLLTI